MSVAVVVPLERPGPEREAAWAWAQPRWHEFGTVCVADDPHAELGLPFSKGRLVNPHLEAAEVVIVADCDVVAHRRALSLSIAHVSRDRGWACPFGDVYRLNAEATADVLRRGVEVEPAGDLRRLDRAPYRGTPGGGVVVAHRDAWAEVGGFDPRFEGWGGEDAALGHALHALVGEAYRREEHLWHLWHPPSEYQAGGGRMHGRQQRLLQRYRRARRDPATMRTIVDEHAGARDGMPELRRR